MPRFIVEADGGSRGNPGPAGYGALVRDVETGIVLAPGSMVEPGFGFGLGFAVRRALGAAPFPGSVGEIMWTGMADTMFWVDPAEELTASFFTQLMPSNAYPIRSRLRQLVYQAIVD